MGSYGRVLLAALSLMVMVTPVFGASILIFGDSMTSSTPNEQTLAESEGHTVTVVSAATWASMTTSDFAQYDAIVIGDNGCSGEFATDLAAVDANRATWSAAVTGNIVVHTFDYFAHVGEGDGEEFVINGINYAAAAGGTGLYFSTGCYGDGESGATLSHLSAFGTFIFDDNSDDAFTIVDGSHPVLTGITESGLENWGSSTHLEFSSVPGDFRVLVTENDQGDAVLVVRDQVVIVPTLSQWSLILLTLLLGSLGLVIVRRS